MKLATIITLSLLTSVLLCYSAMRFAQKIAEFQIKQQSIVEAY